MVLGNSLAKGYQNRFHTQQQDMANSAFDHLIEQRCKGTRKNSRKRYIKNAVVEVKYILGSSLFHSIEQGEGKNYMGVFYALDISKSRSEIATPLSCVSIIVVSGRQMRRFTYLAPIFLAPHAVQRLLQATDDKSFESLVVLFRDHYHAARDLQFGQGQIGQNLLIYMKNGLSIWSVKDVRTLTRKKIYKGDGASNSALIMKTFIPHSLFEPHHLTYDTQRGDREYFHRFTDEY